MRERSLAHPGAVVPRLHARGEALAVARALAADDLPELLPVDRAEVVVAALLVPAQLGVGERDAEDLGLLGGRVDELLAQIVVADPLDAPLHRMLRVRRLG